MEAIAGVIVAGGAGRRMGATKALLPFANGTLLDAVIARVRPQVGALALNVRAVDRAVYRGRIGAEIPLLADPIEPSVGPLGGVLAGLEWLATTNAAGWLATFPCDTPFLPLDLVAQLHGAARMRAPVAARDSERTHALCALWPAECVNALRSGIESGRLRSMMSAVEALDGHTRNIVCGLNAFFNINTPEDLAAAEEINDRRRTL